MSTQQSESRFASARSGVQRFGGFLASMVMPNIGAFIAWGLITALFIPDGWWTNEHLAQLVDPMIAYLLPPLIGYTGGHLVYDKRGGVVGAIATIGVIVSADIPMFLGAMVVGPLAAYLMKRFDRVAQPRTPSGFEMLVNNFSAGILGGIMAGLGLYAIGPVVIVVARWLGSGVQFLIETNPGPGLGILLACMLFGPKLSRATAPGAIIIHFLGGIHEIYFPYVLAQPRLVLAVIGGGMSGVTTFMLLDAGLVATPAPGSIIALMAVTPRGDHLAVIAGVVVGTVVSFLMASALLGFGRAERKAEREAAETVEAKGV